MSNNEPIPIPVPGPHPERRPISRPMPRTPLALSVLNLLNERPMHPYEMRVFMRERGHERAFVLKEASLYDTVARLARRGFIEAMEVNREGRRPERTVYGITERGRDELLIWLRELTAQPAAGYPAFAAPLMFIYGLGRDQAIAALEERATHLVGEIARMDAFRESYLNKMPWLPRIFGIEEEYAQAMRRAELTWVERTVAELRDGRLPWPSPTELEELMKGDDA